MTFPDTPTSFDTEPRQPSWPAAGQAVAPTPKRFRAAIIAAAIIVLGLMAGTGLAVWLLTRPDPAPAPAPANPATLEATGMVTLQHSQFRWNGRADPTCMGWQGYDDIRGGAQVTVTDASGKVLVVGSLDPGTAIGITTEANGLPRAEQCTIPFKVAGIPRGVGPYGVEVSHRGVLRYNESDLSGLMLGFS